MDSLKGRKIGSIRLETFHFIFEHLLIYFKKSVHFLTTIKMAIKKKKKKIRVGEDVEELAVLCTIGGNKK